MTPPVVIAVLGGDGQLGRALSSIAGPSVRVRRYGRNEIDIRDRGSLLNSLGRDRPGTVINAAAYTKVDRAEVEPDLAFAVNADGAGNVAAACRDLDLPLLHVSTDFVFPGTGDRPYRPQDSVNPASIYGRSKADGEQRVRDAGGVHAIVRTAWIFSAFGQNFAATIIARTLAGQALRVVGDQVGNPTPAEPLAAYLLLIAGRLASGETDAAGIHHVAGGPAASWFDLAAALVADLERRGLKAGALDRIKTGEYPAKAPRPAYSVLDTSETEGRFRRAMPDWRASIAPCIDGILRDRTESRPDQASQGEATS